MARISINLLPSEFIVEELKAGKFYKIQAIGVAVILGMSLLSSLAIAFRILQSRNIVLVEARLVDAKKRVSDLKSTQVSLVLLKDRLKVINQYLGLPSKQTTMYGLIDKLIPPSISVNAVTVDRSGETVLVALVPDSGNLDKLIEGLTTKGGDIVKEVSVESINRGRDGSYRVSLKIKPK